MRKILLPACGVGAAIAFALPTMVLSVPERADLFVPTIHVPGRPFEMPIELKELESINGLRRLENIAVGITAQTPRASLRREGLEFEPRGHNDSWSSIKVEASRDSSRAMEYAYLSVTLPEGDEWRGTEATLTAVARLVYPAEVVTPDGNRAYEERSAPISRQFTLTIATAEEERDAAEQRARWEAEDRRWNSAYERWRTVNTVCYAAGGLLVVALLLILFVRRRANSHAA